MASSGMKSIFFDVGGETPTEFFRYILHFAPPDKSGGYVAKSKKLPS